MLLVLESELRDAGCDVLVAPNGQIAAQLSLKDPPQAAIIDYRLPGIDGIELCRQLLANPQTRRSPVILISASDTDTLSQLPFVANIVAMARKPFSVTDLVDQVMNLANASQRRLAA